MKILVAYDGTRTAREALKVGLKHAEAFGAEVHIVTSLTGHENKAKAEMQARKIEKAPEVIIDPFTLQVAAYLKPTYAQKYVEQLKKQGFDAYWREAISANKKWYQVRISHFADKKSARDFGESLKTRGIIDDYYVANYIPPK